MIGGRAPKDQRCSQIAVPYPDGVATSRSTCLRGVPCEVRAEMVAPARGIVLVLAVSVTYLWYWCKTRVPVRYLCRTNTTAIQCQ